MVPPGMKLDMWASDVDRQNFDYYTSIGFERPNNPISVYTVYGRMRDDREGVACQDIGGRAISNVLRGRVNTLRLSRDI